MPFTPLHMGPGMVMKAAGGRHFSLLTFGIAQVVIDIEPGLGLLLGWTILHGWTHTYLGATAIALFVTVAGRPFCGPILRRINREMTFHHLGKYSLPEAVGWSAASIGAFAGTFSHVFLDSLMHADMNPLAPLARGNAMLDAIPLSALHSACIVSGFVGLAAWLLLRHRGSDRSA